MDKKYTADDMRKMANIVINDVYGNDFGGACYSADSKYDECEVASMLRHAADMMEREEKREKNYEYGVRFGGDEIDRDYIFESKEYAKRVAGDYLQVVRREVGVWEDVVE